ncbi:MAG: four helix bundle protein [Anaerolineales bacterium]|nr:four helix bundle protein [Anaerolineales bacterium]
MNYKDWEANVPEAITGDTLWKMEAYRLALFSSDLAWHDVTRLMKDKRTLELSAQLYEAVGSISANLAEGYSYGTGPNRARMYEYALGSARESRDWYYKGRFILGEAVTLHRMALHTHIIRLVLTMIPQQRGRTLREEKAEYSVGKPLPSLEQLLEHVPLPESLP